MYVSLVSKMCEELIKVRRSKYLSNHKIIKLWKVLTFSLFERGGQLQRWEKLSWDVWLVSQLLNESWLVEWWAVSICHRSDWLISVNSVSDWLRFVLPGTGSVRAAAYSWDSFQRVYDSRHNDRWESSVQWVPSGWDVVSCSFQ